MYEKLKYKLFYSDTKSIYVLLAITVKQKFFDHFGSPNFGHIQFSIVVQPVKLMAVKNVQS